MKLIQTICATTLLVASATSVLAGPISATNDGRPAGGLTIGSTVDAAINCQPFATDCQLQSLLNAFEPVSPPNAQSGQQNFGLFSISGGGFQSTAPTLQFEITSNLSKQVFGMWFDNNNDSATLADRVFVPLFDGNAIRGDGVFVSFDIPNQSVKVGGTTYNNFSNSGFGFYLQPNGTPTPTWYSVDDMNANSATMFVAYQVTPANRWYLGFEDQKRNAFCQQGAGFGGDCDHNDIIVSIESIQGGRIPEPGSLALLGLGLAGLAAASRRKQKQA